jgi:protein-S-isoprenylcysteine O-methyltransferase Ste14
MWVISWSLVAVGWFAWLYPFLFRAPHKQMRASITVAGPTRAGLLLEGLAIFLTFAFARPPGSPAPLLVAAGAALEAVSAAMSWHAVRHLGRQFRIHAGLYEDHQLVRTGPYAIVRHPIYSSMMGMLIATILLLRTDWPWAAAAVAVFIAGTEIRLRSEERLLEARFGDTFHAYRKAVSAYIPFVR